MKGKWPTLSAWRPGWRAAPVFAALLAVVLSLTLGFLWSEDVWWYLASGDEVLDRGGMPDHETFLFTSDASIRWPQHSWLWTVIVAAIHRGAGLSGVAVFGALVAAALFALVFLRFPVDRFGVVNGGLAALIAVAANDRLSHRSELATWLLLAVFVLVFERQRPFTRKTFLILAAAIWVGSNLHSGYVLGIGVALAYSLGGWLQGWWARRRRSTKKVRTESAPAAAPPLWLAPALFLVSLATPQIASRLQMLGAITDIFSSQVSGSGIGVSMVELQATFSAADRRYAWLFVFCLGVALWSFTVNRRSPRFMARLMLLGGLSLVAYSGIRFVTGLAVVCALITTANLYEGRPERPKGRARPRHVAFAVLLVLGLGAATVGLGAAHERLEVGQSDDRFFTASTLVSAPGAADYILEHDLPGPIFNDLMLGGYLIHRLYPKQQLYVDNRVLRGDLLREYTAAAQSPQAWGRAMRRYGFKTVVLTNIAVPSPMPLRSILARDPAWRLVYLDPLATVFVRADAASPPTRRAVAGNRSDGVPFLRPRRIWDPLTGRAARLFFPSDAEQHLDQYLNVLGELGEHRAVVRLTSKGLATQPDHATMLLHRGIARIHARRYSSALEDLEHAAAVAPDAPRIVYYLALAQNDSGQTGKAITTLERARQRWPQDRGLAALRRQVNAQRPR